MRTNYEGHDAIYRKLRSEGSIGWDRTSADYDKQKEPIIELIREGYLPQGGSLLDLGCGAGNMSLWFARRGYQTSGIDISPTAIEWAREKAQRSGISIDFRVGNVINLRDYVDGTFHIAVDGHCFHCIIGADRAAFLATAHRVIKKGGTLLINTMCGEVRDESSKAHFDNQSRCLVYDGVASRYIGLADVIMREIQESGFIVHFSRVIPDPEGCDSLLVIARKHS